MAAGSPIGLLFLITDGGAGSALTLDLNDSVTPIDLLSRIVGFFRSTSDSGALTDTASKSISKPLSDSNSLSDQMINSIAASRGDSVTPTDTFTRIWNIFLSLTDIQTIIDNFDSLINCFYYQDDSESIGTINADGFSTANNTGFATANNSSFQSDNKPGWQTPNNTGFMNQNNSTIGTPNNTDWKNSNDNQISNPNNTDWKDENNTEFSECDCC